MKGTSEKRESEEAVAARKNTVSGNPLKEHVTEFTELSARIFDLHPDPLIAIRDMKIIYANTSARHLLGGNVNSSLAGKKIGSYFLQHQRKTVADLFSSVTGAVGETCRGYPTLDVPGQAQREIEIILTGIQENGHGNVMCVIHDMFQHVWYNKKIRDAENRYRTIFETTGTSIIFIEEDMVISMANNELEKITGYPNDQIVGKKKWTEFIAARDLHRLINYHELRRNEPDLAPRNYEFLLKHADGGYRNIFMTIAMIPGSRQSVGSLIDLTRIKQTESALASTEEQYNFISEIAREIIIVYNMEGYITYINRAGCEITGMTRDELLTRKINDIIPSSSNINLYKALADRTVGYDEIFINKTGLTDTSGDYRELETSSTLIRMNNKPEAILVIARDITERKKIEREILKISEGIREQVGRDLHDDLSPHLIGIEALTEVLRMKLEDSSSSEINDVQKISSLINEAIKKTRRLIRGLCPVELGTEGLSSALFNLTERISTLYSVECGFTGNTDASIDDNITAINLYYIAQEASYNAVRHSGAGKIDITLDSNHDCLTLNITDNGSGITLPLPKSEGYGLSIMKHRAEIMNGSLKIKHAKSSGTSVTCYIPLTALLGSGKDNNELPF